MIIKFFDLLLVDDFYYAIDKEAKILPHTLFYDHEKKSMFTHFVNKKSTDFKTRLPNCSLVVATTKPIERGNLLYFELDTQDDESINVLAEKVISQKWDGRKPCDPNEFESWFFKPFRIGYKTAKQKFYTKEDLQKVWDAAIEYANDTSDFPMGNENYTKMGFSEIAASLKPTPIKVAFEMTQWADASNDDKVRLRIKANGNQAIVIETVLFHK